MEQEDQHWRRNLAVCLIGSFTTIVAMTLLLPFLPIYIAELGVTDQAAIAQWSGIAFGATFFSAALVAPFWGWMADRFGRKLMLVRASLGMAVAMSLMGMAHNVWELVGLRLFAGVAGGYASGATILVATQTPKRRSGWALGMLNSGIMAGSLVGPLIGGTLPPLIGIRATFWLAGGVIFLTFLATTFLIKEEKRSALTKKAAVEANWSQIPDKQPVLAMLAIGTLLTLRQYVDRADHHDLCRAARRCAARHLRVRPDDGGGRARRHSVGVAARQARRSHRAMAGRDRHHHGRGSCC